MDRATRLGFAAALEALQDSGLPAVVQGSAEAGRRGVAVGTAATGLVGAVESLTEARVCDGVDIPATAAPQFMPSSVAAAISMHTQSCGPVVTVSNACASGADAIGEALMRIRSGGADVMIAGGVDASLSLTLYTAFRRIGAVSGRLAEPSTASRPFDQGRDGFVLAEGAAFLVLENLQYARRRGARIYALLAGYAANSDAYHVIAPRPDGMMAAQCIRAALADAEMAPEDIRHINAHGTSTPLSDAAECRALAECFGEDGPPVTAPKGVTGHMLGAAGAFGAIVSIHAMRNRMVPPVANHFKQDGEGVLDVVSRTARPIRSGGAVSNSFAFGGQNACLVFAPV